MSHAARRGRPSSARSMRRLETSGSRRDEAAAGWRVPARVRAADMKRTGVGICLVSLACSAAPGAARGATSRAPEQKARPRIVIEDVDRFYKIYDAESGHPTADQLQHEYLDQGSEGLHRFAKMRKISGTAIAESLVRQPEIYSGAKRCMVVLPRVRNRLEIALRTLGRLYPKAQFPPVTIAVGRGKPVAVGSPESGVQIGLEALCATSWLNPTVEDRFVHVIAHEYAHVQQLRALVDDEH